MRRPGLLPWLLLLGCSAPAVPDELNAEFLAPELDVTAWIERFEGESREIAVHREALAALVELQPGESLADVGAGTGLFLEPFAEAVGEAGVVHAVDLSPGFIEHLEQRAEGLPQVRAQLCTERSIELPAASVDAVFLCDTYHHFAWPRDSLASIRRALRPGGRLVVVEMDRIPGVSRDWILEHVRADKATFRAEIEAAGFALLDEPVVPGLVENYVLRFTRRAGR